MRKTKEAELRKYAKLLKAAQTNKWTTAVPYHKSKTDELRSEE